MTRTLTIAALSLGAILAGCNQAPPPAPDTRAADAQAIKDAEVKLQKDWAAKDIEASALFWAADADVFPPGSPLVHGTAAIKEMVTGMSKDPNFALKIEDTKVEVSKASDYGYSQGTYTMSLSDPKTKKALTEQGKFVTVFGKQADGSWKAVADIFNADGPAMPAKK